MQLLGKYTNAIQSIASEDELNNTFKGLFFLPNGNPILLTNDDLINKVIDNSIIFKLNENESFTYQNTKSLSQKNFIDSKSYSKKTKF